MNTFKIIKNLCIASFVVVALTSIPLLITYLKGGTPKYSFIVDLHVWAGVFFIIFAVSRITRIMRAKLKK